MSAAKNTRGGRAIGYVRVSKLGGRRGDSFLSPQLQREEIERAARRESMEVVDVLEEIDVSGRAGKKRPLWEKAIAAVERGEVGAVVVYNISRASRSVQDFLRADERVRAAGGRLVSAQENLSDDPSGVMTRNILLAIAQGESDRARATFAASAASAVERGMHHAVTVPLGYRRNADRKLEPDPDTAPVVVGLFERRGKGWSWVRLARWLAEQGHPMSESGVRGLVQNRAYLGEARYGETVKKDAHQAIVHRGLWRQCQERRRPSARSGRLTQRYLLQGTATCASCGRVMYLSGGNRPKDAAHYICRRLECDEHAYARAGELDAFVLNTIEERLTGIDYDGVRTSEGLGEEAVRAATWVAQPGGDDREVEEAESAVEEARADLDGFLSDTTLRRVLGADRYAKAASDYVAAANKAESDLAEARERHSGRYELVGRLWNTEWGWAERKEWVERMVRSVVVSRGREPLSRRAQVDLR
jgi:DNA invertase Pin-like site-specific DNA recombinase